MTHSGSQQSSYALALAELRMIRDQLVPGRAGPEDVEALTARAAIVATTAQAALRLATTHLEFVEETAGRATPAPAQTDLPGERYEPRQHPAPDGAPPI